MRWAVHNADVNFPYIRLYRIEPLVGGAAFRLDTTRGAANSRGPEESLATWLDHTLRHVSCPMVFPMLGTCLDEYLL